jgi:hypothetical protein
MHIEHTLGNNNIYKMPNEELPSKFNILVSPPKFGQGNKLVATLIELGKTLI